MTTYSWVNKWYFRWAGHENFLPHPL